MQTKQASKCFVFRCFEDVSKVSAYTLVAMLSKETGLMVLPMVVIYHLFCSEGNITNLWREKNTCRTVIKYAAVVSAVIKGLSFPSFQ